ncbi:MAG: hypothetical protein V3U17_01585 [Thermoplasmata archaeon]
MRDPRNLGVLGLGPRSSLRRVEVQGVPERHRTIGRASPDALHALGFTTIPQEEDCSDTVTAVRPPSGFEASR